MIGTVEFVLTPINYDLEPDAWLPAISCQAIGAAAPRTVEAIKNRFHECGEKTDISTDSSVCLAILR